MARVLVVDDEEGLREFAGDSLRAEGHEVTEAASAEAAMLALRRRAFDVVVTDLRMPGMSGLELLSQAQAEQPDVEFVLLTAYGSVETAVEAMRRGAFDFLQKPLESPDQLRLVVARALERRGLRNLDESARLDREASPLSYGDPLMEEVVRALRKVAPTQATVLLEGESGTGKELAARAVHAASTRSTGPFVALNCAALSDTLIESELFGHEKGAFTGADEVRRGRLEIASGGTLFLDEIGELKLELQTKLLRVLQEREFERVGGTKKIACEVRWIAATNRNLEERVARGSFREDLYHRLAVFPVRLPPLRERRHDIEPLARALLARHASQLGRHGLRLHPEALEAIAGGYWPGNVRELSNVLERAVILCEGDELSPEHLILRPGPEGESALVPGPRSLEDVERDAIARALDATGGNRQQAAEILGIATRTLYDKIKRYGLEVP